MSVEEFSVQYERSVSAVRVAKIDPAYREQMLDLLTRVRNTVVHGLASQDKAMELVQRVVLAVALEEGKTQHAAVA